MTPMLKNGAHKRPEDGVCAMEAVAWIAGERHSDEPECCDSVIGRFMRRWNDSLPDSERDLLVPLLPLVVGTRRYDDGKTELRRSWMAYDWLVRTHAPAWMMLSESLEHHALRLRALPEIHDRASMLAAEPVAAAAWDAARAAAGAARAAAGAARAAAGVAAGVAAGAVARDAAWAAAGVAARDAAGVAAGVAAASAAWAAAGVAAWAAAGVAAGAAGAAARAAAWSAARAAARAAAWAAEWDAARDAARDAAWDALGPTKRELQQSACDLVLRMVMVAPGSPPARWVEQCPYVVTAR